MSVCDITCWRSMHSFMEIELAVNGVFHFQYFPSTPESQGGLLGGIVKHCVLSQIQYWIPFVLDSESESICIPVLGLKVFIFLHKLRKLNHCWIIHPKRNGSHGSVHFRYNKKKEMPKKFPFNFFFLFKFKLAS